MKLVNHYGRWCQICKVTLSVNQLTIDHVKPVSQGGGNEIKNLQLLCRDCHGKKDNKPKKYVLTESKP